MNVLFSLLIAVGVLFFSLAAETLFQTDCKIVTKDEKGKRQFNLVPEPKGWIWPTALAGLTGLLSFLGSTVKWLPLQIFSLGGLLGVVVYLIVRWCKDGSRIREFIVMAITLFIVVMAINWVGAVLKAPIPNSGIRSLIGVIPWVALTAGLALMVANALRYYAKKKDDQTARSMSVVVLILGGIIVTMMLVFGVKWGNLFPKKPETTVTLVAAATPAPSDFPHYYNTENQENGDESDDFNFGPDPYKVNLKVSDYVQDFKTRVRKDPLLGSADMAYFDAILGTKHLGKFFVEIEDEWVVEINKAAEEFAKDEKSYTKTVEDWFAVLDKSEVTLEYVDSGLDDQMYMYPVPGGAPYVVVKETLDHSGWFLTFTVKVKEQDFKVRYRINCGYQPTNLVSLGIPMSSSTPTSDPTPTPSDPTPTPSDPTPTPYNKDPNDRMPIIPDDDPGPGPDTNNPDDPWHSTEDRPDGSGHMSKDEYDKKIEELEEINETQREAGDPNTPTVEPAPDVIFVDNDGDKGAGYGNADKYTPSSAPAESKDGETIQNANTGDDDDSAGDEWSGPKK